MKEEAQERIDFLNELIRQRELTIKKERMMIRKFRTEIDILSKVIEGLP